VLLKREYKWTKMRAKNERCNDKSRTLPNLRASILVYISFRVRITLIKISQAENTNALE